MFHSQFKNKGSILVMTIFFMVILFITASAFLVLIPVESRAAMRSEQQTTSALVAEGGVTESLAWLRFQLAPPDGSASREPMAAGVYPSQALRTREMGNNWTYRWSLVADDQTFPNGSNPIRAYTIISRAYKGGEVKREARAEVIQDSLSQYAALYDDWPRNLVMPVRSTSVPAGGPIHINDVMRLWVPEGSSYWTSPGEPKFSHGITASGTFNNSQDGFAYYQGNWYGSNSSKRPYNSSGPINSRYNRMAAGGLSSVQAGQSNVPLPENTFALRDAAWGFNPSNPLPNTPGVHLNVEGGTVQGIYIEGDAEEVQLGVGGSESAGAGNVNYGNNSWVKVELPFNGQNSIDTEEAVTVVSIEEPLSLPVGTVVNGASIATTTTYPADTTLVRRATGVFEYYDSRLNGVVYATGDIKNFWGTNKGRRTVAVESDAATAVFHDIIIGGREDDSNSNSATNLSLAAGEKGLLQYEAVDDDSDGVLDAPSTAENVLGVVGHNVRVSSRLKQGSSWTNSHPQNNPLYLYAVVLAGTPHNGGTYSVESYNSGGAGWTYRYGSRIMEKGGAWGTTSGHGLINGNTFFDEPAAVQPPPYFPSVPSFSIKSYQDLPVFDGETL